jgi:hypothetical protein
MIAASVVIGKPRVILDVNAIADTGASTAELL